MRSPTNWSVWIDYGSSQGYNHGTGKLDIVTTANQDPLLSHTPVIGVDIWEHAFYLQYLNVKADVSAYIVLIRTSVDRATACQYLNAIWNVIDFQEAEKRYLEARGPSRL
jgi:Fe-Mn family superoxide dismutase